MGRNYAAFISYRHAPLDSAAAKMIHTLIERYRIPRKLRRSGQKRFGYVFRDQEELPLWMLLQHCQLFRRNGHTLPLRSKF